MFSLTALCMQSKGVWLKTFLSEKLRMHLLSCAWVEIFHFHLTKSPCSLVFLCLRWITVGFTVKVQAAVRQTDAHGPGPCFFPARTEWAPAPFTVTGSIVQLFLSCESDTSHVTYCWTCFRKLHRVNAVGSTDLLVNSVGWHSGKMEVWDEPPDGHLSQWWGVDAAF